MNMRRGLKYLGIGLAAVVVIGIASIYAMGGWSGFGPGLADYEYRIAGSCTLNRYSAHQINIDCDGIDKRIDAEVFKVGWNDIYLIAASHPVTKPAANNPNCINCEPDESTTYWWIRDLKNKIGFGPMSEAEFTQKKAELKVPDIQMMSVDEAKSKGAPVKDGSQAAL
jgi:hypothetical protein